MTFLMMRVKNKIKHHTDQASTKGLQADMSISVTPNQLAIAVLHPVEIQKSKLANQLVNVTLVYKSLTLTPRLV